MKVWQWLKRSLKVFLRLQWRLTLSYTLVTVGVLTLLMMVLVFMGNWMMYGVPQIALTLVEALQQSSSQLAPSFEKQPVDTAALNQWVVDSHTGGTLVINNQNETDGGYSFTSIVSQNTLLVILDKNMLVLASNHPERTPLNQPLPEKESRAARQILKNALQGERERPKLIAQEGVLQFASAAITNKQNEVLGAVLVAMEPPGQIELLGWTFVSVMPTMLILTVFAGMIGTAFGALTARGLTKRLKKATWATEAWGQGDFESRITDKSADEIGQLARSLNMMADDLENLVQTRQELAALEERNRLARDLHDSVKQQVFATSMNLAAAQTLWERSPQEARERLDAALALSRQSQLELTTLIQTLRPLALQDKGLVQALREYLPTWEKQNHITSSLQVQGDAKIPPQIEQALFRVAQEALSNISRHSGAREVKMSLILQPDKVLLLVCDNGHGFDIHTPRKGLGLRSMLERVQLLGGEFTMESQKNGTCLNACIPLIQKERK